ncbi:MAG: iron-containing alcohol dehydrogenase [Proteobacteria bacterium]|nr:iron-containing alcohol dehydrogenase [Pseudomonadota bacterium]
MEKFKYYQPTIVYFGRDEFERIKKAAIATGKKALIVTGQGSIKKLGYLQKLENYLKDENIKYEIFEGIEPNPRSETINKAGAQARKMNADMIIALGGGSVMDASKGIAIVAKTGNDIWDYCFTKSKKAKKISEALPIICIPSLAATGSEVDGGAVITNHETKQKAILHSTVVMPKYAIIDPLLTMTVPQTYLVDGAVDIICHCIETYLSCTSDVCIPDQITLGVTRTVKTAIEKLLKDPKDIEQREVLSWASSVAMMGMFSGRNGGWPIHLIEHAISGIYDISHGFGLALLMPAMLEFDKPYNEEKIKRFVGYFLHENTSHYTNCDQAIADFKNWLNSIGALRDPKKHGMDKIDKEAVAQMTIDIYGNDDNAIFGVVPMYKDDIISILNKAL